LQDKKGKSNSEVLCMDEWTTFGIPSGASIEDVAGTTQSVSYKEWMEHVVHGDEDQIKLKKSAAAAANNKSLRPNASRKTSSQQNDLPRYPNPSRVGNRLCALLVKQFILFIRNFWFILFSLALPAVIISAFCFNVGPQPHSLTVGLVNEEFPDFAKCMVIPGCIPQQFSCRYLEPIPSEIIEFVSFCMMIFYVVCVTCFD
jgi:hypothetical protein